MLVANEQFHFHIYRRSGNDLLVDMIKSLWLKMGPSLNLLFPAYLDKRGVKHKQAILKALAAVDGAAARAAVKSDLADGKAQIEKALAAVVARDETQEGLSSPAL